MTTKKTSENRVMLLLSDEEAAFVDTLRQDFVGQGLKLNRQAAIRACLAQMQAARDLKAQAAGKPPRKPRRNR